MALKIGRIEIDWRSLVSLVAIAIAYGYFGNYLCTLLRYSNYPIAFLLLILAAAAVFAIPLSLGGLLAAIAAIGLVYWKTNLTYSLISAFTCLALYLLSFQDIRYLADPDQKLSIIEIVATVITIAFTVAIALIILTLQIPTSWITCVIIGAIAGAITLISKQLSYIDLSQKIIWRYLGILAASSLAIGFVIRAILYATTKPEILL